MLKERKTQIVINSLVWCFLCCYFMQLFNFPNVITIIIGGLLCLWMLIKQKRFRLDFETILLSLTMMFYFTII